MNLKEITMNKRILILIFILIMFTSLSSVLNAWDDEELFYTKVKPNIMILFDNSGSMNTIIFHPDYSIGDGHGTFGSNPGNRSSSRWFARWYHNGNSYNHNNWTGVYEKDGEDKIKCGGNGDTILHEGDWIINTNGTAIAKIKTKSGTWLELEERQGTFAIGVNLDIDSRGYDIRIVKIYGGSDNGHTIRYISDYYQWLFNNATDQQREEVSHFCDYGTFDTSDNTNYTDTRVRIRVARKAVNRIIDEFWEDVRMGIFNFNSDDGGRLRSSIKNLAEGTNRNDLKAIVSNTEGNTWTPLAETLAEIWRYFKGDPSFYPNNPGTFTSPCDLYCRKNFVIIMTDGEPTQDTMYYGGADPLRGDHDGDGDDPGNYDSNGTDYLDDVAYYMYNHDAKPGLQENQNVETYTIGFTTGDTANNLLSNTATNGNGSFHTANNVQELIDAFATIMGRIREKSMSFSQFAAPKQSTFGKRGFTANFIPKSTKALWEGHLKAFPLDDNGNFPVDVNGVLNQSAMIWDAAEKLNARTDTGTGGSITPATGSGDRAIFTWLHDNLQMFVKTNNLITKEDLGVATNTERENIFDVIRGTSDPNGYGYKLGDIFHFNPVMVGSPNKWLGSFDPSYQSFYDTHKNRKEVVIVGGNDGMLHCFNAEDGEELWAFIPPVILKNLNAIATNDKHNYFVDGQAVAKDIRFRKTYGDYRDWRTIIVFGLGYGGNSYYCLDITNPIRPHFRWEVGNGIYDGHSDTTVLIKANGNTTELKSDPMFGHTISKPAVGIFEKGSDDRPTAALPGGYDTFEKAGADSLTGKYLVIVNAWNGNKFKHFFYGATSANGTGFWRNNSWKYSIVATPTLVDTNNDREIDSIYQSDIGGNIWKIDITSKNSKTWKPEIIFNSSGTINEGISSQPFFIQPTVGYDRDYNIWLFAGTGYRSKPNDQSHTGHFFAFRDDNLYPSGGYDADDLQDISSYIQSGINTTDSDGDGYTDVQENEAGTDPNDEYSYPAVEPWSDYFQLNPSKKGIYFNFLNGSGEKMFEPTPIYIADTIFFNTYLPPASGSSGGETCNPAGDLFLYQFKLKISGGSTMIGQTGVDSGRILGSGVLSGGKFKIYIGKGEIGSQAIQDQKEIDLEGIFGPIFWIESKR